ncbi:MAG: M1 family aminopeptidase [Nitrosomonadaceae bacterium]
MIISMPLVWLRLIWRISYALFLIFVATVATSMPIVFAAPPLARVSSAVEYDIVVHIDPDAQTIKGRSVITTTSPHELILTLGRRFKVTQALVDGAILEPSGTSPGMMRTWQILGSQSVPRRIEVYWYGKLSPLNTSLNHQQTLGRPEPVSGSFGTFLPDSSGWYPRIVGELASYRVTLEMPPGQRGLVAGRIIEESESGEGYHARFEFPFPSEGIDFMGGPYTVKTDTMQSTGGKRIQLRTYFHPQIKELARVYLDAVKDYIDLYESWIGEYPFTEFSVISSPTPTGFGMPTLTYLGIDVLRLPFIRSTSLGHEVLHNWWGNGVYPYYPGGNWSEGLTTFMADYAYKERIGPEAAREMRLSWLRDFAALSPGQDSALDTFTTRTHGASQIVGYNKAAMMFLMLRDLLGYESFDRALKAFWHHQRFRIASWSDLRRAFETESGQDLKTFFEQWLTYTGAPTVRIAKAIRTQSDSGYCVTITLEQVASSYNLRVPIAVHTKEGKEIRTFDLDHDRQTFSFGLRTKPLEVALDPDWRLFRRLTPDEAPPILRQVMVDQTAVTVLLSGMGEARVVAEALAKKLQNRAPKIVSATDALTATPVLVIGLQEQVDMWLILHKLPARPVIIRRDGTAHAWTVVRKDGVTLAIVSAQDTASLEALLRPLPHYGRQSYVVFDGARAIERGTWPARVQVVKLK